MKYENLAERKSVDKLIDVVSNSYTSRGRCNIIFDGKYNSGLLITKDGKNSIECLRDCNNLRSTAIYRKAHEVAAVTEKKSGDGTSTAALAFLKGFEHGLLAGIDISPSDIAEFSKVFIEYFKSKALPFFDYTEGADKYGNIKKFINTSCGSSLSEDDLATLTKVVIEGLDNHFVMPHVMETPFKNAEHPEANIYIEDRQGVSFNVIVDPTFHVSENKSLDYCYVAFVARLDSNIMNYTSSFIKNLENMGKIPISSRIFIFYQDIEADIAYLFRDREKYSQLGYAKILPLQFLDTTQSDFAEIGSAVFTKYALMELDVISPIYSIISNMEHEGNEAQFIASYQNIIRTYAGYDNSKLEDIDRVSADEKFKESKEKISKEKESGKVTDRPKLSDNPFIRQILPGIDDNNKCFRTKAEEEAVTLLQLVKDVLDCNNKYKTVDERVQAKSLAAFNAIRILVKIVCAVKGRLLYCPLTFAKFGQGFNTLSFGMSQNLVYATKEEMQAAASEMYIKYTLEHNPHKKQIYNILYAIYSDSAIKVIKCYGREVYDSIEDVTSALGLIISNRKELTAFTDGSFREIRRFIKEYNSSKYTIFIAILKNLSSIFAMKFNDINYIINPSSDRFCSCLNEECKGCTLDSFLSVLQILESMCEGIKFSKSLIIDTSTF